MAVTEDYDDVCARLNNLPGYNVCHPTRYGKAKYKDVPMNKDNCPDQIPGSPYFFEQYYLKDHRYE